MVPDVDVVDEADEAGVEDGEVLLKELKVEKRRGKC